MSTTLAVRLHGVHNVRVQDKPIPPPNADESLICIAAVGICGSDLHWFSDAGIGDPKLNHPLILGHEFAGVVESTAQHVAVDPLIACGVYEQCCEGNQIRAQHDDLPDMAQTTARCAITWHGAINASFRFSTP